MLLFRSLIAFLLLLAAVSLVFHIGTGQLRYRQWAFILLKWSVVAGLLFFAGLAVTRIF